MLQNYDIPALKDLQVKPALCHNSEKPSDIVDIKQQTEPGRKQA